MSAFSAVGSSDALFPNDFGEDLLLLCRLYCSAPLASSTLLLIDWKGTQPVKRANCPQKLYLKQVVEDKL